MKWSAIPYKQRNHIKLTLSLRDGLSCCICGQEISSLKAATVEHKTKQRNGGTHELSNLGLAHAACNYSDRHNDITSAREIIDNSAFF